MTLHKIDKQKVFKALLAFRKNYDGSDAGFAAKFDINPSIFSQIKNGKVTDGMISDDTLVGIAMELGVSLIDAPEWNVANTPAFTAYTSLMRICQKEGASRIICDKSDRGKTTAAKHFVLHHKNAFYVDCSENKKLTTFIRALLKSMGLPLTGTIDEQIRRIKRFLISIQNPIVILDEFGDLQYTPFLEMKSFWNGTECRCAWVVIGAQALKKKLERGISSDKVGFEEFFRRFGHDFMTAATCTNDTAERVFFMAQAERIVAANMPKMKVGDLIARGELVGQILSLTRIKERIIKMKRESNIEETQPKLPL